MKKLLLLPVFISVSLLHAQNDRVNDYNNTNWIQSFNTIGLNKRWSLHIEYQWRRVNGFRHWQQGLLRTAVNFRLNDVLTVHAGYAFAETYPYGDYPIANNGAFPEHRLYEQLSLWQPVKEWTFTHRFRIEQRWLRRKINGVSGLENDWFFLHRFRYQFRLQRPLYKKGEQQLYAAAADEIFIGAGKNLGTNIFDQNRIFLLAGFRFNKQFSLEAGYFNQTLQQGRRVNDKTIIQRNNGIVLSSFLNL
ncbi:MAG: DUF2490 domain-containing protein [Chitinophagaceae bacterium]